MKKLTQILGILVLFCAACVAPESPKADENGSSMTTAMSDFEILEGDGWSGSLSYLNYNSEERSTIPVKLAIKVVSDRKLQYAIQYPGEESHNAKELLKLSADGRKIDGAVIVKRKTNPNGTLILITQSVGSDNNKAADIQMIYSVSSDAFSIRKNVKFKSDTDFFNRNEYSFTRRGGGIQTSKT